MIITTTLAAGDLVTAIPSMWNDLRVPLAIIAIMVGSVVAAMKLHKGMGSAIGALIGAVILAALIMGSPGLIATVKQTVDNHGGITVGQYGR